MENEEFRNEYRNLNTEQMGADADFTAEAPEMTGEAPGMTAAPGLAAAPPRKRRNPAKKIIAAILIVVLAAGAGFGGGMAAMYYYGSGMLGQASQDITIKPGDNLNTAEAIAAKVIPSVVGINTSREVTYQNFFFGQQKEIQNGVGTGIIVDEKGYILTNSHVVSDGTAKKIIVQLTDGREVDGTVLWNDKSIDLAIVKIEADQLKAAELGDSDEVRIGAYAVAIGNPLGMAFDRSVTQGVISGLDRTITVTDGQYQTTMDGLLQTDASINSGNSGGPLLNSRGQVIGINSAKAQTGEGLGFAIPINTARPIVDEIKAKGEFNRSYIGVKVASVSDYLQAYPDANLGVKNGAYIVQIYTDSPAAKAGLKEGDIIIGLEGKDVESKNQLISGLFKYRPGDTVELSVMRDGRSMTVSVTLTTMDESPEIPEVQQMPQ